MGAASAALLGAVVGGLLTLGATLYVELRRDRRRQIGSARIVAAEFERAAFELIALLGTDEEAWFEGPHQMINSRTWQAEAAYFVGALDEEQFRTIDGVARRIHQAGDWGLTRIEANLLLGAIEEAEKIVKPLTAVRWLDRRVWRL